MSFLLGPVSGALVAGGVSVNNKCWFTAFHKLFLGLLWLLNIDSLKVSHFLNLYLASSNLRLLPRTLKHQIE